MSTSPDQDVARRAIALLDLTELGDNAADAEIAALCAKARGAGAVPPVAAVCVWPRHAALARRLVAGSAIRVATVINFPSGEAALPAVLTEAEAVLRDHVDEIDLVMPWRAFLAGDPASADQMIRAVRAAMPAEKRLKVILESGGYPDSATVRRAAELAIAAGAHFVKTSTGKAGSGASLDAARAMLAAILNSPRAVGLKPSGGIRALADAKAYLALADAMMGPGWVTPETFRFGASGLHDALTGLLTGAAGQEPRAGY